MRLLTLQSTFYVCMMQVNVYLAIYIYICIAHEKDKRGFVLKEVVICIHDFKN